MPTFRRSLPAAALALATLWGCSDSTGGGHGPAATLDIVSGNTQSATVGTELPQPLVVKVVDAKGKPVPGQAVNFVVTAGGGHVFAGTGITNSAGIAQERWTLGTTAGAQTLEARAVDSSTGQALVLGTFTATATAAAPNKLIYTASMTVGIGANDSLRVQVLDAYNNPVSGTSVAWTADGGTLASASTTTDAAGYARVGWTIPVRGDFPVLHATATVTGLAAAQITAQTALPAGSTFSIVSGNSQSVPAGSTSAPLVVKLQLPGGAPVSGATVSWAGTGATPASGTSTTAADGTASTTVTFASTTPHAYQVQASAGGAGVGFTGSEAAGPPASLTLAGLVPPNGPDAAGPRARAGSAQTWMRVRVTDAYGNPAPGVTVSWTATNSTITPSTTLTDSAGYSTPSWVAGPSAGVYATARASVSGIPGTVADSILIISALANHVVVTPDPAQLAVGDTIVMQATAYDAYGNTVLNTTRGTFWSFAYDSNVVSVNAQSLTSEGKFKVVGRAAGSTTLTATLTGVNTSAPVSGSASVTVQ